MTVSGNGQLVAAENLNIFFTTVNINDSAYVLADSMYLRNPNVNPTIFNFNGGTIQLQGSEASNPFRLPSGVGASSQAALNFTGDSGRFAECNRH